MSEGFGVSSTWAPAQPTTGVEMKPDGAGHRQPGPSTHAALTPRWGQVGKTDHTARLITRTRFTVRRISHSRSPVSTRAEWLDCVNDAVRRGGGGRVPRSSSDHRPGPAPQTDVQPLPLPHAGRQRTRSVRVLRRVRCRPGDPHRHRRGPHHVRGPRRGDVAARIGPVVRPAVAHHHPRWGGDRPWDRGGQFPQRMSARVGDGDGGVDRHRRGRAGHPRR
jgi:hypothetical protein